jgi:hypothetical protein
MECGIIDECRCYLYKGEKKQFCAARRGKYLSPCPSACCAGGCSGQPFRIVDKPRKSKKESMFFTREYLFGFFTIVTLFFLVFHDLKISDLRKI